MFASSDSNVQTLTKLKERYNLSDPDFDYAAFDGWMPSGYGPDKDSSTARFKGEDIVIVSGGAFYHIPAG